MASNSIRVGELLFSAARQEGALMSRSTAQQIEHWAHIGAALESVGLSVSEVAELLLSAQTKTLTLPDHEMWASKRAQQAKDVDAVRSGRQTNADMSWFSGGRAKAAKLVDSPY